MTASTTVTEIINVEVALGVASDPTVLRVLSMTFTAKHLMVIAMMVIISLILKFITQRLLMPYGCLHGVASRVSHVLLLSIIGLLP